MISFPQTYPKVVVVDAQPNDYATVARNIRRDNLDIVFLPTGRAALRFHEKIPPRLWVINIRLPDMSGLDLYKMLEQRWPDTPVYLVGDDYRPEDEIHARMSGATFYFCKPLESDWLSAAAWKTATI